MKGKKSRGKTMAKNLKNTIESGGCALGIEFGSTRIKAVLIGEDNEPLATGGHDWENKFENGIWTYALADVVAGMQDAYKKLADDVFTRYGATVSKLAALGVSAMMHGYLVFDDEGRQLAPFCTWRNNNAAAAAETLTKLFAYPVPARWSAAHLYRAILSGEEHVKKIAFQTTLEGWVHYLLTGEKVIGIGEASGMFPVDTETKDFDAAMLEKFDAAVKSYGVPYRLKDILPKVLVAGEDAGALTEEGARLLDPTGKLAAGVPMCPPEGDAGTGMVATNSVKRRTGNVSAGTSVFAMIVLEKPLSKVYPEIDLVTTPAGDLVGMVHCNNCTSDLNAWVDVFGEFARLTGRDLKRSELFELLYRESEKGDADCGGLISYNYVSNEHITGIDAGRPLFARTSESKFTLANLMRSHLFASLGALKIGCDILLKEEGVKVDAVMGHGGLFKTEGVGQSYLAAALNAPVTVMKTAGEGGAWGIAILANYRVRGGSLPLEEYLAQKVFAVRESSTLAPDPETVAGYEKFVARYKAGLPIVREAVRCMGKE